VAHAAIANINIEAGSSPIGSLVIQDNLELRLKTPAPTQFFRRLIEEIAITDGFFVGTGVATSFARSDTPPPLICDSSDMDIERRTGLDE
jgi:hypothetical protein